MPQRVALGAAVYAFYDALGSFETTPGTTASALSVIKWTSGHTGEGRPRARAAIRTTTSFSASLRCAPDLKAETPEPSPG